MSINGEPMDNGGAAGQSEIKAPPSWVANLAKARAALKAKFAAMTPEERKAHGSKCRKRKVGRPSKADVEKQNEEKWVEADLAGGQAIEELCLFLEEMLNLLTAIPRGEINDSEWHRRYRLFQRRQLAARSAFKLLQDGIERREVTFSEGIEDFE